MYLTESLIWFSIMPQQQEKIDGAVQRNKDGLIYSTLAFDGAKSAKPPPPKQEKTEYVSIDLKKTELLQNELTAADVHIVPSIFWQNTTIIFKRNRSKKNSFWLFSF